MTNDDQIKTLVENNSYYMTQHTDSQYISKDHCESLAGFATCLDTIFGYLTI